MTFITDTKKVWKIALGQILMAIVSMNTNIMTKILIVYFSRGGNTAQVAETISSQSGAALEPLVSKISYEGVFGYIRALRGAMRKKTAEIEHPKFDPDDYDLVVVGSPVWGGNVTPPVRRYLQKYGHSIARLAVFCTEGGSGEENTLLQMAELCGQKAVASLVVKEKDLKSGNADVRILKFSDTISHPPEMPIVRRA